jgi:nucleoside-diphosphate-sugar epimerase
VVVATGGASFIGSHLVEQLLLRRATVRIVDEVRTILDRGGLTEREVDSGQERKRPARAEVAS